MGQYQGACMGPWIWGLLLFTSIYYLLFMTEYLKRLLAVKSFELGQTVELLHPEQGRCRVTGTGLAAIYFSSFENSKYNELQLHKRQFSQIQLY